MKALILITLLLLGACTQSHVLAKCEGPSFAMNPGDWTPTEADLVCPQDK